MKEYICLDLEMTGLNPKEERIIEIGAVKIVNGLIIDSFQAFANPNRKLKKEIREITGISDEMLIDARSDWEIVKDFMEFSNGFPLVGHHMITDVSFLKQCAMNRNVSFPIYGVDTLYLARKFMDKDISKTLTSIADYLEIEYEQSHRAMDDARITNQIYCRLLQDYGREFPECFQPKEIIYKVKKQGPITAAQIRQLETLLQKNKLTLQLEISQLTKNEASRMIDKIILQYGRNRSDDV